MLAADMFSADVLASQGRILETNYAIFVRFSITWRFLMDGNGLKTVMSNCVVSNERFLTSGSISHKFRKEWYVSRTAAEIEFDRFLASDARMFLVLGDSGSGKTNYLCNCTIEQQEQRPVLFLSNAQLLEADGLIDRSLVQICTRSGEDESGYNRWIHELSVYLESTGSSFLIVIDGINEFEDLDLIKREISRALEYLPSSFRIVVSCRTDSFRTQFQDSAWDPFLYRGDQERRSTKDDAEELTALRDVYLDRFRSSFPIEQQQSIESALDKHIEVVRARKRELSFKMSVDASILLGTFNEVEFHEAMRRYRVKAKLLDEAREHCHDPLMFRLFYETYGDKDVEVANVFGIDSCMEYLNACTEGMERRSALELVYRIAEGCRYRKSVILDDVFVASAPAIMSGDRDGVLRATEQLVDAGLLSWDGWAADGTPESVKFNFDRLLSFCIALNRVTRGREEVERELRSLHKEDRLTDIDMSLVSYLLLLFEAEFCKEGWASDVEPWVERFIDKRSVSASVIKTLGEFEGAPDEYLFTRIGEVVRDLEISRSTYGFDDVDEFVSFNDGVSVDGLDSSASVTAISTLLASLARRGKEKDVLEFLALILDGYLDYERSRLFYPFIKPLAIVYDKFPDETISLIKSICGDALEVSSFSFGMNAKDLVELNDIVAENFFLSSSGTPMNGFEALAYEVANFPDSRISLIETLSSDSLGLYRLVATKALPGLAAIGRDEANRLFDVLINDLDNEVRASLATSLVEVYGNDKNAAMRYIKILSSDRDVCVRGMLAVTIMRLFISGEEPVREFVMGLCADDSPYVRGTFVQSLPKFLGLEDEFIESFMVGLAADSSYRVRQLVVDSFEDIVDHNLEFGFELLYATMKGGCRITHNRVLKALEGHTPAIVDPNLSRKIDWQLVGDRALDIARLCSSSDSCEVRYNSVPLVCKLVEEGIDGAEHYFKNLLEDREVQVARCVLNRYRVNECPSHVAGVISGCLERIKYALPDYRNREVNELVIKRCRHRIRYNSAREQLQRILQGIGESSIVLPVLLALSYGGFGGDGFKASTVGSVGKLGVSFIHIIVGVVGAAIYRYFRCCLDFDGLRLIGTRRLASYELMIIPVLFGLILGAIGFWVFGFHYSIILGVCGMGVMSIASVGYILGRFDTAEEVVWGSSTVYALFIGSVVGALSGAISSATAPELYFPILLVAISIAFSQLETREVRLTVAIVWVLSLALLGLESLMSRYWLESGLGRLDAVVYLQRKLPRNEDQR